MSQPERGSLELDLLDIPTEEAWGLSPDPPESFERAGSIGMGVEVGATHTFCPLNASDHAGKLLASS